MKWVDTKNKTDMKQWDKEKAIEGLNIRLIEHEEMLWEMSDSPHDISLAEEEAVSSRGLIIQYVRNMLQQVENE